MSYNLHVRYKPPRSRKRLLLLWAIFIIFVAIAVYFGLHGLPHNLFHHAPPPPQ